MDFWIITAMMALSIPIIAILSDVYLKRKKVGAGSDSLQREIARLRETNAELINRIENLETIVTSADWEKVLPPSVTDAKNNVSKVRQLAEKLNKE